MVTFTFSALYTAVLITYTGNVKSSFEGFLLYTTRNPRVLQISLATDNNNHYIKGCQG